MSDPATDRLRARVDAGLRASAPRLNAPTGAPVATPAPAAPLLESPTFAQIPVAPVEEPQITLSNLGLTNPAWLPQTPQLTLTTEFTALVNSITATDPAAGRTINPSVLLAVRDRLDTNTEFGAYGSVGASFPRHPSGPTPASTTTNGTLGLSLRLGPEAPSGDAWVRGFGYSGTLGQTWGAEPARAHPAPGWTFNPTLTNNFAYSIAKPNAFNLDLIAGGTFARWGAVNGLSVGGFASPFLGFNASLNVSDRDALAIEATAGVNLGFGGRSDGGAEPRVPAALAWSAGLGFTHAWGDYGFGLEPYVFGEAYANANNPSDRSFNYGGGFRFGFGAINPRRGLQP